MLTRRTLLQSALALPLLTPTLAGAQDKGFRFVHFTDIHIQPELHATEGVASAVKKLLSLDPRPDFVVIGGDCVMDWNDVSHARADLLFGLFQEALKPLEMPIHYTIGNHDVYGWTSKDAVHATEPEYGKRMFEERVVKGKTYYGFDKGNWRFLVLDSIGLPAPREWRGEVDETQLQWLKTELEQTGKQRPIVIVTHIPLITAFNQYNESTTAPTPDSLIVRNGKQVRDLFQAYNVKAVLQGHTHVIEECVYHGVRYVTSGAVCGEWWKGPRLGVDPEGFTVFDVTGDSLTWHYVDYGWKAVAS